VRGRDERSDGGGEGGVGVGIDCYAGSELQGLMGVVDCLLCVGYGFDGEDAGGGTAALFVTVAVETVEYSMCPTLIIPFYIRQYILYPGCEMTFRPIHFTPFASTALNNPASVFLMLCTSTFSNRVVL
jgi:hypothetical protein